MRVAGLVLSLLLASCACESAPADPDASIAVGPPFPRLANIYLQGAVDPSAPAALARWDLAVVDTAWDAAELAELRSANADILVFPYVCAYCIGSVPFAGDPWDAENVAYAADNDLWWYDASSQIASDWPGAQMINITDVAPGAGPRGAWRAYLVDRIEALLRERPDLDGVFFDNFWARISWAQPTLQLDSDCSPTHNPSGCDAVPDDPTTLDARWHAALTDIAVTTRARLDVVETERPLAIVTNGSTDYFTLLNGTLYESFLTLGGGGDPGNPYGYNFAAQALSTEGYLGAQFQADPYRASIVNAMAAGTDEGPDRTQEFERHKRFTLGVTLCGDGYYSLDRGTAGHGALWWEPEYDHDGRGTGYLGHPTGAFERSASPTGAEMVSNGSFSGDLTGWTAMATSALGMFERDTSEYHSEPAAARLVLSSIADPSGSLKVWQSPLSVQNGVAYTLSFWARSSEPVTILAQLYADACPNTRCMRDFAFAITPSWTEHVFSFVSSGTADAGVNVFLTVAATVWIDDLSLREGDTNVFRRSFERGIVLVNATGSPQVLDLGASFYRLLIAGSSVWDGAQVTSETVPPWDARILLESPP